MAVLRPMRNTIFVLPDKADDKSKGGIILTEYSKKRPTTGVIIAVGPLVNEFTSGQHIVYGEFSGEKKIINYNGEDIEIFLMTEEDILALLE